MANIPVTLPDELVEEIKELHSTDDEYTKFNMSAYIRTAVINQHKKEKDKKEKEKKK